MATQYAKYVTSLVLTDSISANMEINGEAREVEIPLASEEEGIVGVVYVFKDKKSARKMHPGSPTIFLDSQGDIREQ